MSSSNIQEGKGEMDQAPPPPYSAPYNPPGGEGPGWTGKQNPGGYGPPQGYPANQGFPPQTMYVQGHPGSQPGQVIVQYPVIQAQPLMGTRAQGPMPKDFMVLAIFATVFCFFPTGIVAIMKSSEVKSAVMVGDMQRATRASERAKKFIYISIFLGIVCYVGLVILTVFAWQYLHDMYMEEWQRHI